MRRNIFLWLRMRASWWLAHQPFQGKVCLKSVSLPSKDQVSQKWDGPFLSIFNIMIHNSTFSPFLPILPAFLSKLSMIFFAISLKGTRRPDHGFLLLQNLLAGGGESQRQWARGLETKTGRFPSVVSQHPNKLQSKHRGIVRTHNWVLVSNIFDVHP